MSRSLSLPPLLFLLCLILASFPCVVLLEVNGPTDDWVCRPEQVECDLRGASVVNPGAGVVCLDVSCSHGIFALQNDEDVVYVKPSPRPEDPVSHIMVNGTAEVLTHALRVVLYSPLSETGDWSGDEMCLIATLDGQEASQTIPVYQVSPTPPPSTPQDGRSIPIVAVVLGILFGIATLGVILWYVVRRKRKVLAERRLRRSLGEYGGGDDVELFTRRHRRPSEDDPTPTIVAF